MGALSPVERVLVLLGALRSSAGGACACMRHWVCLTPDRLLTALRPPAPLLESETARSGQGPGVF